MALLNTFTVASNAARVSSTLPPARVVVKAGTLTTPPMRSSSAEAFTAAVPAVPLYDTGTLSARLRTEKPDTGTGAPGAPASVPDVVPPEAARGPVTGIVVPNICTPPLRSTSSRPDEAFT